MKKFMLLAALAAPLVISTVAVADDAPTDKSTTKTHTSKKSKKTKDGSTTKTEKTTDTKTETAPAATP
jgi:hypothetical protein